MNVMITGAARFIGGFLAKHCTEVNSQVLGIDIREPQHGWAAGEFEPAIKIRIFETTGPGELDDICSDLTRRAIEIDLGIRPPLMPVGNLANRRSNVDVRDLVHALWALAEHFEAGQVYNLGGDDVHSVQDVIEAIRTQLTFCFEVGPRLN